MLAFGRIDIGQLGPPELDSELMPSELNDFDRTLDKEEVCEGLDAHTATLKRDEGMSMEPIASLSLPPLSAIAGERPPSVAAFSPLKASVR
ncbi:hypothetical protein MUK42_23394 [Musa troglodytarum]|uniref:Uncharacterized protein n=1 Tax=Musa troglodytarum TaxID=320322 RepID=A0A9E7GCL0_9LILI|nr:hypothetical protein MUK42_23394 [Musa troglodytarum]